uniref:DNA polymerase epsilon catalytic subunit n=1 Tax=Meloidogyne javanica TaxID=6303 RepID=A0A915ME31_MELJA
MLPKNGWLVNVQQSEVVNEKTKVIQSVVNFYFLESCGGRFKISYLFRPYLYLETVPGSEFAVAEFLSRKYHFVQVEHVEKENLDLKNHLSGLKSKYLRVSFPSTVEHVQFRRDLFPQIRKNQKAKEKSTEYTTLLAEYMEEGKGDKYADVSPLEQIMDIREYDLPFDMRVCIDGRFFVGHWYTVVGLDLATQKPLIELNPSLVEPPEPIICAFDIETTKAPLKFPDASEDQIMMISYMIDGSGFLIVNRQIISEDIDNFEYTPKPEFVGEFVVFNEENEQKLLLKFFDHLLKIKPSIMVTYNGDFFDWPFVDARANFHGININKYLGFYKDSQDEYKHFNCVHMDAFSWVQRDSYLPMGSQSLKAATREKLRYDPIELDPEEMVPMAKNQPKVLANYSVSDAVSTYYLYTKYVHPFIFALCTIIPLSPDDVNGHLIDSETYVGGHVEAIESGVFRADIACRFKLDVEALEQLKEEVRPTLEHSLCNDAKILLSEVLNFESICEQIEQSLDALIEKPLRTEHPELYHLDVGAMYPNIILTNRLQPPAIVNEEQCMACIHNAPDAKFPASKGEYDRLMMQLEQERFGKPPKPFNALPKEERIKISKKRITEYCKTAYKRLHDTKIEQRNTTICQREHSFYVDTVRAFRDRRYEYKEMHKKAKASVEAIPSSHLADRKSAQSRVILYDSLQMAHKCILNSFYGYVMRKGSRWFSMEMAGIVCHTGANIIREARQLIERIGRPLELDTDGIWCLLPSSFPQNFVFETLNGKKIKISYPAAVLNALVKDRFTNEQYHTIIDDGECIISSENSIFFEVDGPYYAMILPASKEEGKKLKKRYAVFNFDKTLAELKGFEVKRRGELAII